MRPSRLTSLIIPAILLVCCTTPYKPDLQAEWTLTIESLDASRTTLTIPSSEAGAPAVRRQGKKTTVCYTGVGGRDIEVSFSYVGEGRSVEVTPSLTNREEGWVVLALTTPEIRDLGVDVSSMKLLMPNGAGYRHDLSRIQADEHWKEFRKDGEHYFEARMSYPQSRQASMQWMQFSSGSENLYLASHDPEFRWKYFQFRYFPEEKRVAFLQENRFTCFPGESWVGPPTMARWTEGSWKTGAKTYHDWYCSVQPLPKKADWMRKSSGWLMTILKNQNGIPIWSYPEVGTTLLNEAERRGIDVISLFGWTVGGHDRFYPDYDIDPEMGGEEALKESIRRIHERGKQVTLYYNGQLIDTNGTRYWPDTGRFVSTINHDRKFITLRYGKFFSSGPKRPFGKGCYRNEVWCNRLMALAMKTHELGADGLLYDQVGVAPSMLCYGEGHGHPVPAVVYERDRLAILKRVSDAMEVIHPGFMIVVEGLQDCEMPTVQTFWGYSPTSETCHDPAYIRQMLDEDAFWTVFPDMYRYTFPEADFYIRAATPASTRGSLNFGTTFGYKHEIECRYVPDKRYLIEGIIPQRSEYDDIIAKTEMTSMENQDPAEVVAYSKAVMDFRRKYEDLLYVGNFNTDNGFTLASDGKYVLARSFVNGNKMGVVVWNCSDEDAATFTVTPDSGWTLAETVAPEGTPVEGALPAQSIRMLIYNK